MKTAIYILLALVPVACTKSMDSQAVQVIEKHDAFLRSGDYGKYLSLFSGDFHMLIKNYLSMDGEEPVLKTDRLDRGQLEKRVMSRRTSQLKLTVTGTSTEKVDGRVLVRRKVTYDMGPRPRIRKQADETFTLARRGESFKIIQLDVQARTILWSE